MIEQNIKSPEIELISKNAKEEFVPGENQFKKLIENAPDGIAIVGTDGKFKYVSPSAKKIFGFNSEADIAIDPNEATHPEDLNKVLNALNELIADPSLVVTLQYRFLHNDGTWHWIESNFSNMLAEPGIEGFIINFRSIEERKRIEDELVKKETLYSTLFNLSPAGIMLEDMDGNIVDINNTYLSLTDYSREELIGQNVRKIVPPEYLDEVDKNITRINSGETLIYEISTLRKDGTRIEIELRETMITLPNGEKGIIVVANDISERKRGEEILRKSENKYRTIFENVQDAYYETSLEGIILSVSPSIELISGGQYHQTDLIGKSMSDFYSDTEQRKHIISLLHQKGSVTDHEVYFKNKDGLPIACAISAKLYFDTQGRPAKIIGSLRNITDRKLAEEKLIKSEARLKYAQRIGKIGNWDWDIQSNELFVSDESKHISGIYAEDKITIETFLDSIDPADIEFVKQSIDEALSQKKPYDIEMHIIRPDGIKLEIHTVAEISYDDYGKPVRMFGTVQDISERKKAEKQIKFQSNMLNTVGQAVMATDLEGKIIYWNEAATKMYGWAEEEVMGKNVLEITPAKQTAEQSKKIMEKLLKGESWQGEFEVKRKDGTSFFAEITDSPIFNDKNELVGVIGISSDISKRKLAEKTLIYERATLDAIVNNIPVMITRYDPNINMLLFNKEAEKLLGYSTEEASKINLMENVYPDPEYRKQVADYMSKAKVEWREFQCRSKSGEIIDSEWSNIRLDDGTQIGIGIDVRERKKGEKELIESEKKYRILFENNPHPMWVYDVETLRFLAVNKAAIDKYGYSIEEFLSMTLKNIRPEEDIEGLIENISQRKELIQEPRIWRHILKNGYVINVEILSHSLIYENKTARLVLANDVTKRLEAEKQLKLKSENLSKLLEISLSLNQSYDKHAVFQKIVDSSVDLIGLDSGALYLIDNENLIMSATFPQLPTEFPEEYRKAKLENHPYIKKAVKSKSVTILKDTREEELSPEEKIIVNSSGFRSLIYLPLISEDIVIGILILGTKGRLHNYTDDEINLSIMLSNLSSLALTNSILFDKLNINLAKLKKVLEEKEKAAAALIESERTLSTLIENLPGMVYRCKNDKDWTMVYVSPVAKDLSGYDAETFYGSSQKNYADLVHPEDLENIRQIIQETLILKKHFELEYRIIDSFGKTKWVWERGRGVYDQEENLLFLEGYITDITDRKKAEIYIEESRKKLIALNRRIQDLREEERTAIARELHDELGQLLTAIKIDLQSIKKHPPYKKSIPKEIDPVINLVEESILSVRKLSSDLRPNILDQLGLLASMEWQMSEHKRRLKTEFVFNKPQNIGIIPMKKTVPVFRVFQELLTNIARHANASRVDVLMEVNDSNMKLIVSDNGVGMAPAAMDNNISLGILGMRERLNVIGGTLSYSSQPGKGTDAEVFVPLIYCDEIVNMAEQTN